MTYELNSSQAGTLHEYAPNLTAFEFNPSGEIAPNVVLFIGGLGNGLLNVPYVGPLSRKVLTINSEHGKWVLIQGLISASYQGWGVSSLKKDAYELSLLVKYLRSENGGCRKKIVLAGHSTGCQDAMQYLSKLSYEVNFDKDAATIDGAILQAPVSDVESFALGFGDEKVFDSYVREVYEEYISKGRENEILPEKFKQTSFNTPITAYRFYSLTSKRGDDDLFSSYLVEEDHKQTFGKVNKPLLVLYGSKDEFVPDFVNKEELLKSWELATAKTYWSPLSKVLKGATHNVGAGSDEGAVEDLVETIIKFIETI